MQTLTNRNARNVPTDARQGIACKQCFLRDFSASNCDLVNPFEKDRKASRSKIDLYMVCTYAYLFFLLKPWRCTISIKILCLKMLMASSENFKVSTESLYLLLGIRKQGY